MNQSESTLTIGILFPGEMGARLGELLVGHGHRVVTTTAQRSPLTIQRAQDAGMDLFDGLEEVVRSANLILSVVPPAQSVAIAERVAACVSMERTSASFLDLNSVSPDTSAQIARILEPCGVNYMAGSIHGLARNIGTGTRLYVSGQIDQSHLAPIEQVIDVVHLGSDLRAAKAIKMLLGGFSKGLASLFINLATLANQLDCIDTFSEQFAGQYPDFAAMLGRYLPTYHRHAARRADEAGELVQLMESLGLSADLMVGNRSTLCVFAEQVADGRVVANSSIDLAEILRSVSLQPNQTSSSLTTVET